MNEGLTTGRVVFPDCFTHLRALSPRMRGARSSLLHQTQDTRGGRVLSPRTRCLQGCGGSSSCATRTETGRCRARSSCGSAAPASAATWTSCAWTASSAGSTATATATSPSQVRSWVWFIQERSRGAWFAQVGSRGLVSTGRVQGSGSHDVSGGLVHTGVVQGSALVHTGTGRVYTGPGSHLGWDSGHTGSAQIPGSTGCVQRRKQGLVMGTGDLQGGGRLQRRRIKLEAMRHKVQRGTKQICGEWGTPPPRIVTVCRP